MAPPKQITLSGTPWEIGFAHGVELRTEIRSQIHIYAKMFEHTSNLRWGAELPALDGPLDKTVNGTHNDSGLRREENGLGSAKHTEEEEDTIRSITSNLALHIKRLTPDLYQEMQGIAAGAKVDDRDIVALNCRSEIALGRFQDGCTSLAWKQQRPRDDNTNNVSRMILAQNWDWTPQVKPNLCLMSIFQEGKPKIWMVTEAGIIGKIGFNSAGVGVCLNAIRARPTHDDKLPIHLALRLCLESTSVQDAVQKLESLGGVASSQHILVADPSTALGLELSPLGNVYLPLKAVPPSKSKKNEMIEVNGAGISSGNRHEIVTHTNHFIENKFVDEPHWLTGSPIRLARINELMASLIQDQDHDHGITREQPETNGHAKGDIDVDACRLLRDRIFSDTMNAPQSICCQADPSRHVSTRSITLFNILMELDSKKPRAEVVWGRPGSGEEGDVIYMPWD